MKNLYAKKNASGKICILSVIFFPIFIFCDIVGELEIKSINFFKKGPSHK